jgi:hypothetical protein
MHYNNPKRCWEEREKEDTLKNTEQVNTNGDKATTVTWR